VSAKSISVPSMSKKYAQSDRGKGGRAEGRRAHRRPIRLSAAPSATVPSQRDDVPAAVRAAHRGGVHQQCAPPKRKTLKS